MKPDPARSLYSRWAILLAGLTAVAGTCLSLSIRSRIAQAEATGAQLSAETLRQNTKQELTLFGDVLESVCALHALSDAVDQAAMNEFIEKGLVYQHAILGSFGLAQRISPQLRTEIEGSDQTGPGSYALVQQGPDGSWISSETRPVYYPLTWQSHTGELNIPVGFDFASHPGALQAIRQIEQTRRPALVPVEHRTEDSPLRPRLRRVTGGRKTEDGSQRSEVRPPASLSPSQTPPLRHATTPTPSHPPSYWVFAPVVPRQFKNLPVHMPGTVIGFAVAVLDPDIILNRVSTPSGLSPELKLSLLNSIEPESGETIRRIKGKWIYSRPLEALGTQWIFECSLPVASSAHHSTVALLFGLIVTALMTSQLWILGSRTRKIEAEVLARTDELRLANVQLEENLLERAHLEEEMNELAARERRRFGRDLHDSLGQKLTAAVFLSRSLLDYLVNEQPEKSAPHRKDIPSNGGSREPGRGGFSEHAKTLNETLKDAVAQVRNMARGLAPVTLNDERLGEALEQLAEEMTGLYGVSCEVAEQSEPPTLSRKTKEQLYLIAREAVNNAARHAQAERITLRLIVHESGWILQVEDNGKGLPEPPSSVLGPPSSAFCEGMGIRIMKHRARLIGAEFSITSVPDQGTCITVKSV